MALGILSESLGGIRVCRESQVCDLFATCSHKEGKFMENHNVLDFLDAN